MKIKKIQIISIALFIFLLSLFFNMWGISGGTPSEKRTELVFENYENVKDLIEPLKKSREDVYESYSKKSGSQLLKLYSPSEGRVDIVVNRKKISIEKEKLHSLRSALLQDRFPDEQKTFYAISRIKPNQFKFDPGVYQYGGIYFYSCGLAIKFCEILGICKITSDTSFYMLNPRHASMLYTSAKTAGAIAAAVFCVILFLTCLEFFSFSSAIFSALFACVLPSIQFESHSLKPFSFFLPFFMTSVYFALKSLKNKERFNSFYFLSGIFSGLSAGSMLFGGFSSFSFLAAFVFRAREKGQYFNKYFFIAPVGFVIGFFISNPYYLISFKDALNELLTVSSAHNFYISFPNMIHFALFEAHKILSWPVYLLGLVGIFFAFYFKDQRAITISMPFLVYFFYTSNAHWDFPHYSMPLVPAILTLSGWSMSLLIEKRRIFYLLFILFFVWNIGNSLYYKKVFSDNEKNLFEAGEWINKNIPFNSSIGSSVYPYFGFKSYPPFSILNYHVSVDSKEKYYIVNDINHIYKCMDLSYRDKRAQDTDFFKGYELVAKFSRKKTFLDRLYSNYLYILFEQEISIYKNNKSESA